MKLEKLSDNQIRCTLNKADLAERELKISELAYGTEKAKDLFREMMQQASYEFGFEAEDIPLMIEAIPVSADCIILVITKVEDPEELDTRFSKFTPSNENDDNSENDFEDDDISSLFSKIQEIRDSLELNDEDIEKVEKIDGSASDSDDLDSIKSSIKKPKAESQSKKDSKIPKSEDTPTSTVRVFSFNTFDQVTQVCNRIGSFDIVDSALYKDTENIMYYLVIAYKSGPTEVFNQICNTISEFATRVKATYATESYYKEHYETIIKANAINILSTL